MSIPDVTLESSDRQVTAIDDRNLAIWYGRIAVAARKGGGLDVFKAALTEIKQNVPLDTELEHAKSELWGAAQRHLADAHGLAVLDAIYSFIFPEEGTQNDGVSKTNSELDARAIRIDDSNAKAAEIRRLAQLKAIDYDSERGPAANRLRCRLPTLDDLVKKARGEAVKVLGQGRPLEFSTIEPWQEFVSGAGLLDSLASTIRKYVIVTEAQADALALWSVHTHAHDAAEVSPKLILKSAQKRSGKSRLVAVLARITAKPFPVSGIKPAALLRVIEMYAPTLLLDEMDAAMRQSREMGEALRGLINSGFDRAGARFVMNVPTADGGFEPHQFSTWAPQVLAGIGDLPDTVRDRSIEIEMVRKRTDEAVARLRRRDGGDLNSLSRKSLRWVEDNVEDLRNAEPAMPKGMSDRAADAWEPLFAIADVAGGDWPQRSRAAALTLSGESSVEDGNIATILLAGIRTVFTMEQIKSETLVRELIAIEAHPWAEFGRFGEGLTPTRLARLLKPYKIRPGTIRTGVGPKDTAKGYRLTQFADAFARYLPSLPVLNVTPSQANDDGLCAISGDVTRESDVSGSNAPRSNDDGPCDGVTVSTQMEDATWELG